MQSVFHRVCKVGVLAATVSAILALCFGALSLGFRGDTPMFVRLLTMGLGVVMLVIAVAAIWCRLNRKRV